MISMQKKLVFATNNAHKLGEVRNILNGAFSPAAAEGMTAPDMSAAPETSREAFELVTLAQCGITEEIPENEPTIEGNALAKARYVYSKTGLDCFADDTGLEVAALGGEPGVRSARYAGEGHDFEANKRLLLKNLESKTDRSARFRTVIALILDGCEYTSEGVINGRITAGESGCGGFGYDSLFIPDGYSETFAQMPATLKNEISHRAIAVRKLTGFLHDKAAGSGPA